MNRGDVEEEQETLSRIAGTLLRLAVLAEFLCILPFPLRALLLPLMRYAEAVARAFATERAGGALALPPAKVHGSDGDGRAEALRLARCLRALAVFLGGLQDLAGRLPCEGADWRHAQHASATGWGQFRTAPHASAFRVAGCIDTS